MSDFPHCIRVAIGLGFTASSEDRLAALLHDAVEDGQATTEQISRLLPEYHAEAVEVVTRRAEETYEEYIERVATSHNSLAWAIKFADLRDNVARCGNDPQYASLEKRYRKALERLSTHDIKED